MKFKSLIILVLVFIVSLSVFAQREHGGDDKIKAMKVGMITSELNLSEAQAQKFWPIYNEYSDERGRLHREIRHKNREGKKEGQSSVDVLKTQDEILDLRKDEIDLTRKYRDSFLKIISAQQYGKLMESEKKFNELLLQKLKEKRQH